MSYGGVRIGIAFDDPALEPDPVFTWVNEANFDDGVRFAQASIDRGRQYEVDHTDTGRLSLNVNDRQGVLDPTNSAGPYFGKLDPDMQIVFDLWNPVTSAWSRLYRGFIDETDYVFNPNAYVDRVGDVVGVNQLTIGCVDLFGFLSTTEMHPGSFGDTPAAGAEGMVFFDNATVHDRIVQILTNFGLDPALYVVFTGNVNLLERSYSPGDSAMSALQESVDAEFPGVSNHYVDRLGRYVFHGRLAKFDPEGTAAGATPGAWDWNHWKAGDGAAVLASIADTGQIREFSFNRGIAHVINSALSYPLNSEETDIAAQVVQDLVSIGLRGFQTWQALDLLTESGILTGLSGLAETRLFSQFYVNNYAEPRDRVTNILFKSMRPDDARAAANWRLLCGADISDRMDVTIGSPGGGGFTAAPNFVEGVHYEITPLAADYANVELRCDLSPMAYFTDPAGLTEPH